MLFLEDFHYVRGKGITFGHLATWAIHVIFLIFFGEIFDVWIVRVQSQFGNAQYKAKATE